jgi:hypothetical protein
VPHVIRVEEANRLTCIVDDMCFEVPTGYKKLGNCIFVPIHAWENSLY